MQAVLAGAIRSSCCRPAAASRSAFRPRRWSWPGLAVVVSPLISLMKDQVDALADNGVPAACVNSTLVAATSGGASPSEIRAGRLKLLYLSPERLMTERTLRLPAKRRALSFFAIDEAHCISDWGHDFRPEYRMLRQLKERFPARRRPRLHGHRDRARPARHRPRAAAGEARNPRRLVRPAEPGLSRHPRRATSARQIREVIDRHPGDSGIIYCIRRTDVEDARARSCARPGYVGAAYHAGLDDDDRRTQPGRLHQRPGRDHRRHGRLRHGHRQVRRPLRDPRRRAEIARALPAGKRPRRAATAWKPSAACSTAAATSSLAEVSRSELPPEAHGVALAGAQGDRGLLPRRRPAATGRSSSTSARRSTGENCQACDVCLGEIDRAPDALVIAQKILSCVLRLKESFGGEYTAQVLDRLARAADSRQRPRPAQHLGPA